MKSQNRDEMKNKDPCPSNEILKNLSFLTKHLTNLDDVLIYLLQHQIISYNEMEIVNSENTPLRMNNRLLFILQTKDYQSHRGCFLDILRNTGNGHCADKIEGTSTRETRFIKSSNLTSKWWLEEKTLPNAFHKRKIDATFLTTRLKAMLLENKSDNMTVITQKVTVSGLGGIGKTTTAIWFAQEFKEDYDYILWIDCGEQSLLNTFTKLARTLKLEHQEKLDLKELALGSFQYLKDWKCLFIFDNAESYYGNQGIKDALPKSFPNFDTIITSRNKQWGDANGIGEVPQFEMKEFDQQEGVEFLKRHIKRLPDNEDLWVSMLCELLGNLPLALQIAIATINREKIDLQKYIDRIKNTPEILHKTFDSYEKTINKTLQISLDIIKSESDDERGIGELAHRILVIFGYITPDDIPSEFFLALENDLSNYKIDKAINLLECYSLISKKVKKVNNVFEEFGNSGINGHTKLECSVVQSYQIKNNLSKQQYSQTVSIHRLLQQVIRYNTNQLQEKMLEKILTCEGFLDYKIIPYSFANKELQRKFSKLKTELIDKVNLGVLLHERRFKEALELSRIILNTLQDPVSKFNFAVCLQHNSELDESKHVLRNVLHMVLNLKNKSQQLFTGFTPWGTIDSSALSKSVVLGQIFSIYVQLKNWNKARNVISDSKDLLIPIVPLNDIIDCIDLTSPNSVFLQLHEKQRYIDLQVKESNVRKWELHSWIIDNSSKFPIQFEDYKLTNCKVTDRRQDFIIAKNVKLCHVNMEPCFDDEKIETLTLEYLRIPNSCIPRIYDQVILKCVTFDEWLNTQWVVNKLFLHNLDFTHTNVLKLTELEINNSLVNINILPNSLKKLTLNECFLINCSEPRSVGVKVMPGSLQELSLINVYVEGKHKEQCTNFDISHFISPTLSKLKVKDFGCNCSCLQLSLNCLTFINSLYLDKCCLELVPNIWLVPIELHLINVGIIRSHIAATNAIIVNQFVDMSKLQILCLTGMTCDFNAPVHLRAATLINTECINWETGSWSIHKLIIHPNPGHTQMMIKELQSLKDPENVKKTSNMERKKEKLLSFLKSISGSRTISGLYLATAWKRNIALNTIQRISGMLPGILTTDMPKYDAGVDEWQSFVEKTISDWKNHYLVHIKCCQSIHPLQDMSIENETSWNDLIEENGERNKLWKQILDTLVPFLLQLQIAGVVPILTLFPCINYYNPYISFYDGHGGMEGSLKIFQITKDYLTHYHGLTSLIWNWYFKEDVDMTRLEDYWPGNNYVDVVSVQMMSTKILSTVKYLKLLDVAGDKPISMEFMFSVPFTEQLAAQKRWTWFTILDNTFTYENLYSEENTKRTFMYPSVINRGANQFFN